MNLIKESEPIQKNNLKQLQTPTSVADFVTPKTYTGLAGFHKYWGKKPVEGISYLIENCTFEGDIVMDPFLGSGLISRECLLRNRRFIGIDINPFCIEYTSFLLDLPPAQKYHQSLIKLKNLVAEKINQSYLTSEGQIASHYLWEGNNILSVWIRSNNKRKRIEIKPTELDFNSFLDFKDYQPKNFRNLNFFTNSRINVKPSMTVNNIFTGRAIRNIDILIEAISIFPPQIKRAFLLTLTSSAGQMSNMVFAIKNRNKGKNKLNKNDQIEVGSWVIGYWLPDTHFEINVWNCFENRANKLLKALPDQNENAIIISNDLSSVNNSDYYAWLVNSDCRSALKKIPSDTISFVVADPPHSDRIPYLELSELWNSLLGHSVNFENEIVVSNAKERNKSKAIYNLEMTEFFMETSRVLKANGYIAIYFNARDKESWQYLKDIEKTSGILKFLGAFPMAYSATSVIQDNRKGAMKNDYVLIYQKRLANEEPQKSITFERIPEWSAELPKFSEGEQI